MAPTTRPKKDIDYTALAGAKVQSGRVDKAKAKPRPKMKSKKQKEKEEREGWIIAEDEERGYLIDWADGPKGEKYSPVWQPKEDTSAAMVVDWHGPPPDVTALFNDSIEADVADRKEPEEDEGEELRRLVKWHLRRKGYDV